MLLRMRLAKCMFAVQRSPFKAPLLFDLPALPPSLSSQGFAAGAVCVAADSIAPAVVLHASYNLAALALGAAAVGY